MKSFYIVGNSKKDENLRLSREIAEYLEAHGRSCALRSMDQEQAGSYEGYQDAECILVLGGDGTLLRAARELAGKKIPFLGINLGHLGYLAEIEQQNMLHALDRLMADDYTVEERMMLEGRVFCQGSCVGKDVALNDIVLNRRGDLRVIYYHIYVNDQYLTSMTADGMIVCTPTGSTGYNLSAGGPIMSPTASMMVLTPICPHTLNSRSIVLSGEDRVRIQIGEGRRESEESVGAVFDGAVQFPIGTGDFVDIQKSEEVTRILKINQVSFLEVLRNKLSRS